MTQDRRYQDHEVRQILDLAIGQDDAPTPSLPAKTNGLTLQQLQEVGREVGLSTNQITQAVATFEGRGEAVTRTKSLGLPTSVSRIVPLPRDLSEREWERLVAELRTTFDTKGVLASHGSLREWSYGDLHAFVEPTETGYRLRMTDSRAALLGVGMIFGGIFFAMGLLILAALLSKGDLDAKLFVSLFFSGGGGGLMALSAMTLPGWARTQEQRMQHIGQFTMSLLAAPRSNEP